MPPTHQPALAAEAFLRKKNGTSFTGFDAARTPAAHIRTERHPAIVFTSKEVRNEKARSVHVAIFCLNCQLSSRVSELLCVVTPNLLASPLRLYVSWGADTRVLHEGSHCHCISSILLTNDAELCLGAAPHEHGGSICLPCLFPSCDLLCHELSKATTRHRQPHPVRDSPSWYSCSSEKCSKLVPGDGRSVPCGTTLRRAFFPVGGAPPVSPGGRVWRAFVSSRVMVSPMAYLQKPPLSDMEFQRVMCFSHSSSGVNVQVQSSEADPYSIMADGFRLRQSCTT